MAFQFERYRGSRDSWQASVNTTGTSVTLTASPGTGFRKCIASFDITNTSATAVVVAIKSGSTTLWQGLVPAGTGIVRDLSKVLVADAATAITVEPASGVSTIYANAVGYTEKTTEN